MLIFEERGNLSTRRKPLGAGWRTNKFNSHVTSSLKIDPGPHWWQARALNNGSSLHLLIKHNLYLIERYQLSLICFFNYLVTYFLHPNCLFVCYFPFLIPLFVCVCFLSLSPFLPFLSFSVFSPFLFHSLFLSSSSSLFVFLSYPMFDFVWLSFFGRPYVLFLSILQTANQLVSILMYKFMHFILLLYVFTLHFVFNNYSPKWR